MWDPDDPDFFLRWDLGESVPYFLDGILDLDYSFAMRSKILWILDLEILVCRRILWILDSDFLLRHMSAVNTAVVETWHVSMTDHMVNNENHIVN